MPKSKQPQSRYVSPIIVAGAQFERVDQGVDWNQVEPYVAVGDGTVSAITGGWHGGTGLGVYITLDHPITVNGRTYDQVYYAELRPLVKQGQRVKAGQPVVAGGAGELGFAHDNGPVAPLVGGLGAGTQPSVAGHDFLELATGQKQAKFDASAPVEHATASFHDQKGAQGIPRSKGGGIGFDSFAPVDDNLGGFGPQESMNQEGAIGLTPYQVANVWQEIANQQTASPETRLLANNAADLVSNVPDLLKGP